MAGRYLAQLCLEHLNAPCSYVETGEYGEPLWPGGFIGSISHSHGFAVCIAGHAADHNGLGIDIQRIVSPKTRSDICRMVVNKNELPILNCDSRDMETSFTLIFAIKEAFFKAAFPIVQKYFGFECISVTSVDPGESGGFSIVIQHDIKELLSLDNQIRIRFLVSGNNAVGYLAKEISVARQFEGDPKIHHYRSKSPTWLRYCIQ